MSHPHARAAKAPEPGAFYRTAIRPLLFRMDPERVHTAMVYFGPGVVKSILQGLVQLLERDGFSQVSEAVGVDVDRR